MGTLEPKSEQQHSSPANTATPEQSGPSGEGEPAGQGAKWAQKLQQEQQGQSAANNTQSAAGRKQRRPRFSFTGEQIRILEQNFQRGSYSDVEIRERIQRETGLDHLRIQVSLRPFHNSLFHSHSLSVAF